MLPGEAPQMTHPPNLGIEGRVEHIDTPITTHEARLHHPGESNTEFSGIEQQLNSDKHCHNIFDSLSDYDFDTPSKPVTNVVVPQQSQDHQFSHQEPHSQSRYALHVSHATEPPDHAYQCYSAQEKQYGTFYARAQPSENVTSVSEQNSQRIIGTRMSSEPDIYYRENSTIDFLAALDASVTCPGAQLAMAELDSTEHPLTPLEARQFQGSRQYFVPAIWSSIEDQYLPIAETFDPNTPIGSMLATMQRHNMAVSSNSNELSGQHRYADSQGQCLPEMHDSYVSMGGAFPSTEDRPFIHQYALFPPVPPPRMGTRPQGIDHACVRHGAYLTPSNQPTTWLVSQSDEPTNLLPSETPVRNDRQPTEVSRLPTPNGRRQTKAKEDSGRSGKCEYGSCPRGAKPHKGYPKSLCSRHWDQWERNHAAPPIYSIVSAVDSFENARNKVYTWQPACHVNGEVVTKEDCKDQAKQVISKFVEAANTPYKAENYNDDPKTQAFHVRQQEIFNGKAWAGTGFSNEDINVRMRFLYEEVAVFHAGGVTAYPQGGDNGGYGAPDTTLTFHERIDKICEFMKMNKRVCADVIEGRGVTAFARHPVKYNKRKTQNKDSNQKKQTKQRLGDAVQAKRKAKGMAEDEIEINSDDEFSGAEEYEGKDDAEETAAPERTPFAAAMMLTTDPVLTLGYNVGTGGDAATVEGPPKRTTKRKRSLGDGDSASGGPVKNKKPKAIARNKATSETTGLRADQDADNHPETVPPSKMEAGNFAPADELPAHRLPTCNDTRHRFTTGHQGGEEGLFNDLYSYPAQ